MHSSVHLTGLHAACLQVASLTNLREALLTCGEVGGGASYFNPLASFSALTRLRICFAEDVPACLSALTQLRSLHLDSTPFVTDWLDLEELEELAGWEADRLAPALEHLTGLTRLLIANPPPVAAFPASLTGLLQLRRFGWLGNIPGNRRLPPGPWLSRLRQLAVMAPVAKGSAQLWRRAVRLKFLQLQYFFGKPGAAAQASRRSLLTAAAALPRLQELRLGCEEGLSPDDGGVQRAAAGLLQHISGKVNMSVSSNEDLYLTEDHE